MPQTPSTRWCPTPEQLMILEDMYRGGLRTPNASQIQQITAHLACYGRIEGKNVFYWFQNHKARERQKRRLTSLDVNVPAAGAADATTSQLGVLSLSSPPPSSAEYYSDDGPAAAACQRAVAFDLGGEGDGVMRQQHAPWLAQCQQYLSLRMT